MVVQNLSIEVVSTLWSFWESNWKSMTSKEWLSVWELGSLKEDCFDFITFSDN